MNVHTVVKRDKRDRRLDLVGFAFRTNRFQNLVRALDSGGDDSRHRCTFIEKDEKVYSIHVKPLFEK
jgi:hypothetical protein